MENLTCKILSKLSQSPSSLYQTDHPTNDFVLNYSKLWISFEEFEKLREFFPFFSSKPLISGLLFSKSKKPHSKWFKAKLYSLYQDHLILYAKTDIEKPKKVMILKGVNLRLLEEMFDRKELRKLTSQDIIEKKSLILSRKENFEIFFAGTDEMHNLWVEQLRKCCILHHFKQNYKITAKINSGHVSNIYEARSLKSNETFAVKTFEKEKILKSSSNDLSENFFLNVENEINISKRLENKNILQLKEIFEGKNKIYFVFDLLKGGDLFQKVTDNKYDGFLEKDIKYIMKQLLEAITYVHSLDVMHRDIKLANILFIKPNDLTMKLADFGIAEYEKKQQLLFKKCGTAGFVAPEILKKQSYDKKCDLFSIGIVLYILITGRTFFFGKNYNEVYEKNKKAEEILENLNFNTLKNSPECIDLLKKLLKIDPNERISAQEALSHQWFQTTSLKGLGKIEILKEKTSCFDSPKLPRKKFEEKKENDVKILKIVKC